MQGRDHFVVALMQYLQTKKLYDRTADGLLWVARLERSYFDKLTVSLVPMMEKLMTGKIGELISPDYEDAADRRPVFDWLGIIQRGGIVYVGLDAMSDFAVSAAVGNSMFADLVSVAGHLYKHGVDGGNPEDAKLKERPAISIHADEFNELIGEEFIPLLNKAGGAGLQVTAYTQTLSDIEARIGNPAKARQIIGNCNNLIMLRVRDTDTAELLTEQLPEVQVHTLTLVSGVTDTSDMTLDVDFQSRNEDRVNVEASPMLTPADIVALPKGQAFCLLEGGQLWKVRFPLPGTADDPAMPSGIDELARRMEEKYATANQWWVGAGVAV